MLVVREIVIRKVNLLVAPHDKQSDYEFNGEKYYSVRAAAKYMGMSHRTLRRKVDDNNLFHCKINDRVFLGEWQILAYRTALEKKRRFTYYRVRYSIEEHGGGVKSSLCWDSFNNFDHTDRDKMVQRLLDSHHRVEIFKRTKPIREIILDKLHMYETKEERINEEKRVPKPQLTNELLISSQTWCNYHYLNDLLSFSTHEKGSWHVAYIPTEKFFEIKKCLSEKETPWLKDDLLKLLEETPKAK